MMLRIAIPMIASALVGFASAAGQESRGITPQTLRGYLDKMGLQYVPHPKNQETLVVPRVENKHADRLDLYVEIGQNQSLVLTVYPKFKGRYFSLSRAADREKLLKQLLETNHRAFSTFFVDDQGDIGARFTFTTENSVGFESFRAAVLELMRIADQYTPVLAEHMNKEAEPGPK
jgi:hypothetical protein